MARRKANGLENQMSLMDMMASESPEYAEEGPAELLDTGEDMGNSEGQTVDILPTAKAGGFLHQPPLHSNRGCCVLHDVRQALLPVCPTVRYVFIKRTFAQALYAKY